MAAYQQHPSNQNIENLPAHIAALPSTNIFLESSFHNRDPLDLASWIIPASFRPPTQKVTSASGSIRNEAGVLRVAPKRINSTWRGRHAPPSNWSSDVIWLIAFGIVAFAIWVLLHYFLELL